MTMTQLEIEYILSFGGVFNNTLLGTGSVPGMSGSGGTVKSSKILYKGKVVEVEQVQTSEGYYFIDKEGSLYTYNGIGDILKLSDGFYPIAGDQIFSGRYAAILSTYHGTVFMDMYTGQLYHRDVSPVFASYELYPVHKDVLITADWWNQQDYVPKCCIIPPRRPVDGPATGYVIVGDSANNLVALVSTFGTTGSDVLSGSGVIFAGDGNDFIIGGFGADFINGEAGDDTLLGGEGTDLLSGDAGNDTLISGDGNDTLTGGSGADLLSGGSGVDMVSYASSAAGVIINLATGRGTGGDAAGDQVRDIENVIGSGFNDVISVGNASVVGFDAANYYAMNPDVQAYAAAHGLGYDWAFEHWVANGRFEGRAGGWEGMSQAAGADWGTLFSVQKYLAANSDILAYKLAHNLSDQWVHEHWLTAGRHEGRAGALDVSGSAIDAGAGNDVVQGGLYSDYVTGNTGNDTINGYAGDDVLLGGAGHDAINGGDGNDHIFGGLDDDGLVGAKGNDSLSGGTGNDSLFGDDGNDTLAGGSGTDTLYGGAGDDYLDIEDLATAGADELHGGDGNDVLVGGGVGSKLTGGAGYDIFSIRPNAKTTIMDFYTGPGAHDQIYIWNKPLFADFSAMMATARQVGSDVVIEKSDFSLTLSNTQLSSLIANDFVFL